jgi:hypothetical protein
MVVAWSGRADSPGVLKRQHLNRKINVAAFSLDVLVPSGGVDVLKELGKSLAFHGHYSLELFVDTVQFASVEPKAGTIVAIVQDDVAVADEKHLV